MSETAPAYVTEALPQWDRPGSGGRSRRSARDAIIGVGTTLAALASIILIWQLASMWLGSTRLPGPVEVAEALWDIILHRQFLHHTTATLIRVLGGMVIALALGLLAGMPMGLFRPVERFFRPYVIIGLTIPALAWALIAVLVVGINDWAPIATIVISTAPVLTLNIWQGTKAIDRDLLAMASSLRAGRWLRLRHVLMPQLVPYLLAGMRMGLSLAWKIVVLSEAFGLADGVGQQLQVSFSNFSLRDVMAWTAGFALVMSLIEFVVFAPLERHLTRWRPRG
jgi:NitT/TauT family transport system permease protein